MKILAGLCLSVSTLITPLWASEHERYTHCLPHVLVATPAATKCTAKSDGYQIFLIPETLKLIGDYAGLSTLFNINRLGHVMGCESAALIYAQALLEGSNVPKDALICLRNLRVASMRDQISRFILQRLRRAGENVIYLSNPIPPFLRQFVKDKKSDVDAKIDWNVSNDYIADHLQNSVGYYYEYGTGEDCVKRATFRETRKQINNKIKYMPAEYMLLDQALTAPTEDMAKIKYIVIPNVGPVDAAITSRITDLDMLFNAHPELTLVVAFNDDVQEVFDGFCCPDHISVHRHKLSTSVKKLSFTGKNVKKINTGFFCGASCLQSVDFRGLRALESVANAFFSCASTLISIDCSGLAALESIGDEFFMATNALQFFDTRGLNALKDIGASYFSNGKGLRAINLRHLKALKKVGWGFLQGSSVEHIDLSDLTALEKIDRAFLGAHTS